jgi:hypothetical protein
MPAGASELLTGAGSASATGTILAGTGGTPNCASPVSEVAGFNLSTDSSCGLSRNTDLTGLNPMLGPLADNGGPGDDPGTARLQRRRQRRRAEGHLVVSADLPAQPVPAVGCGLRYRRLRTALPAMSPPARAVG